MKAFITVDLGFGDSGKGTVVDSLVRQYSAELVVRFNGGCQAGHNVYTEDGAVHHCFNQIGSTLVPKTYTLLSQFMLVNPLLLLSEAARLAEKGVTDAINRVFIDNRAIMAVPYHRALNRLREMSRGAGKFGSCGMGIGECMADALANPNQALQVGDLHTWPHFAEKLLACRNRLGKVANALPNLPDTPEVERQLSTFTYDFVTLLRKYRDFYMLCGARCIDAYQATRLLSSVKTAVFEAAQGVLLDEKFGFHPHTTWSTTTTRNARLLLEEAELTDRPTTIGIIRSYMTRHGVGPFPTESQEMTRKLVDLNNPRNPWQDGLRCGPLDLSLIEYALRCNGPVDCLAVTHLDKVTDSWPIAIGYDQPAVLLGNVGSLEDQQRRGEDLAKVKPAIQTVKPAALLPLLEQVLKTRIGIASHGPLPGDKQFRWLAEDPHKIWC